MGSLPDIRTLGDVADPLRLEEVWLQDSYEAAPWVHEGGIVVDVGANVGEFTIWAAQRGALVTAVEPERRNVEQLRTNLARLGIDSVAIRQLGLGATNGFCSVAHGPSGDWSLGGYTVPGEGTVPMEDLDTLLAPFPAVDVLKIDIEGAEYDAFAFASPSTLSRIRYIAIEVHLWTVPGEPERVGIGVRGGSPCPSDPIPMLIDRLERTHHCDLRGTVDAGGYLFATRRSA